MTEEDVERMIAQRQATHGDFRDVGVASQQLCSAMRTYGKNWHHLPPYVQEGLEMIQHKVARILSGDWTFSEHLLDIEGYARRVRTIVEEDKSKCAGS